MDCTAACDEEQMMAGEGGRGSLVKFESRTESERLQLLLGDRDLVLELGLSGFKGKIWRRFAGALAAYGLIVMRSWICTGEVFAQCAKRGIGGFQRDRVIPKDEAEEMAIGTVGEAIGAFRDRVLIPGKWDHKRGATLKTFFIGQCIFQFPNVYRAWCRDTAPPPLHEGQAAAGTAVPGEWDIARRLQHRQEIGAVEDGIADMVAGEYMGFTQAEIAQRLGMSVRAVEGRLWRLRKKARESEA